MNTAVNLGFSTTWATVSVSRGTELSEGIYQPFKVPGLLYVYTPLALTLCFSCYARKKELLVRCGALADRSMWHGMLSLPPLKFGLQIPMPCVCVSVSTLYTATDFD